MNKEWHKTKASIQLKSQSLIECRTIEYKLVQTMYINTHAIRFYQTHFLDWNSKSMTALEKCNKLNRWHMFSFFFIFLF